MRSSLSQQIQSALTFSAVASSRLTDAQNHAVSGKRIMRPSDDAPGTNRALSLRSTISTVNQLANNIVVSKPLMQATQGALNDLVKAVQIVRGIAMQAGEPDFAGNAAETYIADLGDILTQMADIANTNHTGQFIFSGTATTTPAVQPAAGPNPYAYTGDQGTRTTQILSWVTVPTNIPGDQIFNFDGRAGAGTTDLFTMVTQLQDAIRTGDGKQISAQLDNIDANLKNLLANTARFGSWTARMENAQGTLADSKLRLQQMISDTEDIDLPEAVVQLKMQENVYQTAIAVTSRMLDLSLASLNFK